MATLINLEKVKFIYKESTKTFTISEKEVPFATEYEILNPKTGKKETFDFYKSTGPEFDPNTKWLYANQKGLTLEVCNDKKMTEISAANYLAAKTRR
ncbi:MAG: hypothetical protein ABIP51_18070 [Bacteroidia bacterium]